MPELHHESTWIHADLFRHRRGRRLVSLPLLVKNMKLAFAFAILLAKGHACFRGGEIRILDSNGSRKGHSV